MTSPDDTGPDTLPQDALRQVWGPPTDAGGSPEGTTVRLGTDGRRVHDTLVLDTTTATAGPTSGPSTTSGPWSTPGPWTTPDAGAGATSAPPPPTGAPIGTPPPPPPAAPGGSDARRPGLPLRSYVAVALTAALGAGLVVVPTQLLDDEAPAVTSADVTRTGTVDDDAPSAPVEPLPGAADGSRIAAIAERLTPSVLRIDVGTGLGAGSGSGVVLDSTGHVLTNAHVVENATAVSVLTPDGQRLEAEVVGEDASTDIAVIRVDAELPVPSFSTDEPTVGELAVAIGSPFGLDSTVTSGIISGVNRQLRADDAVLFDLLQTDAAINPGNSGGALVNARGEVVGINTAILSRSGANDGVGFAVPASTALAVAEDLIKFGEVRAGWLGIQGQTVSPEVAELYDLDADSGAVIESVLPETPAAEADLREGDIIVAVDDTTIATMQDLAAVIREREPGDVVELTILRDAERIQLELTLGTRPSDPLG